jgi:hypothetical protein
VHVKGAVLNDSLLCTRFIGVPDRLVLGAKKNGTPYMLSRDEVEAYYLNTVAGVPCVVPAPRVLRPASCAPRPAPRAPRPALAPTPARPLTRPLPPSPTPQW